jgi:hypothetical protein
MRPEVEEWAQQQLAAFPPPSPATKDRLAALLSAPVADQVGGDGHPPAA